MKIGFYINISEISDVDMRYPEKGNPGIGGTPFCFVQLARNLTLYHETMSVYMFIESEGLMPIGTKTIIVNDVFDAIQKAKNENIDIFIFRPENDLKVFNLIDQLCLDSITWGHNFYSNELANLIASSKYIKRNVFVGRQQYDRYIDHDVIKKSIYIFNSFNFLNSDFYRLNDSKTVTYVGSLVPAKGFHVLANQWKKIVNEVPEAKLKVIGTGNVYSRNARLGKFAIAEEKYENSFMKHLLDENGQLLESVEFLGLLGQEKVEVYQNTSVGIVNPTARTEICSISTIEMEACGIPIVTKNSNGFPDTVIGKLTGTLYRYEYQLAKSVINLLKNKEMNNKLGDNAKKFVQNTFEQEQITKQWVDTFYNIKRNIPPKYIKPSNNWGNNFKFLRFLNRKLKGTVLFNKIPPIIFWESKVKEIINRKSQ